MVDTQVASERRRRAIGPDNADLAQRRHGIKCPGGVQRRRRRLTAGHQVQAARTVRRFADRLGGYRADPGLRPRHDRADREHRRLHRHAELTGPRIAGHDRVRHGLVLPIVRRPTERPRPPSLAAPSSVLQEPDHTDDDGEMFDKNVRYWRRRVPSNAGSMARCSTAWVRRACSRERSTVARSAPSTHARRRPSPRTERQHRMTHHCPSEPAPIGSYASALSASTSDRRMTTSRGTPHVAPWSSAACNAGVNAVTASKPSFS